jgi:hypothetical protein
LLSDRRLQLGQERLITVVDLGHRSPFLFQFSCNIIVFAPQIGQGLLCTLGDIGKLTLIL